MELTITFDVEPGDADAGTIETAAHELASHVEAAFRKFDLDLALTVVDVEVNE